VRKREKVKRGGLFPIVRVFMILFLTRYYWGDNDGEVCGSYGGENKYVQGSW
jgi:hypothetical protein